MKTDHTELWESKVNTNRQEARILAYVKRWTTEMEKQLEKGKTLEGCMDAAAIKAGVLKLTSTMQSHAISLVGQLWAHGEELKQLRAKQHSEGRI